MAKSRDPAKAAATGVFFYYQQGNRLSHFPEALAGLLGRDNVLLYDANYPAKPRSAFDLEPLSEEVIAKVHTPGLIRRVKDSGAFEGAMFSAAGTVNAAMRVAREEITNAFVFTGYGDHHAGRNFFGGGCCFNGAAIAIQELLEHTGYRRFAVIDTDPHHGDGSWDVFLEHPEILYLCFCQGAEKIQGRTVNCRVPFYTDDETYATLVQNALARWVKPFSPQLLFWNWGYDGTVGEYGDIGLSPDGQLRLAEMMTAAAGELCENRLIVVLCGGSRQDLASLLIPRIIGIMADRTAGQPPGGGGRMTQREAKRLRQYPRSLYLDVNGLRLHCLDWGGEGQPMLCLHGFMGHARVWETMAREFSHRFRIFALDQRGHGLSQWPSEPAYDIEDHYIDVAYAVEALRLNRFILVGHSMGGRNALFYTAFSPNPVACLVLVEARPGGSASASAALRHQVTTLPRQAGDLDEIVRAIRAVYPRLTLATAWELALHGYYSSDTGTFIARYDQRITGMLEKSGFRIRNLEPYLYKILIPTLVVRGSESQFLSAADAQRMVRIMGRAKLSEINNASHVPHLENSKSFHREIDAFLTGGP